MLLRKLSLSLVFLPFAVFAAGPDINDWGFDISKANLLANPGFDAKATAIRMFGEISHTITDAKFVPGNLDAFVTAVQSTYHNDIPYHTFYHGVSAMQFAYMSLQTLIALHVPLTPVHKVSLMIASLCHDIGHPGRGNKFVFAGKTDAHKKIKTDYPTGTEDNILEQMHAGITDGLLTTTATSPLVGAGLTQDDKNEIKRLVRDIILATVMGGYKQVVIDATTVLAGGDTWGNNPQNIEKILHLIMAAADLSNSVRGAEVAKHWTPQILDEFGQEYTDRGTYNIQQGFEFQQRPVDDQAAAGGQAGFLNSPNVRDIFLKTDQALKLTGGPHSMSTNLNTLITYWTGLQGPTRHK